MKKILTDILASALLTMLAVVGGSIIAAAVMTAGALAILLVGLPLIGAAVLGWSWWWCALYACVTVVIYLFIKDSSYVGDDDING